MHSKIKDKGTKGCTASNCIKAKDGNLLMEREDVLNRWSEYIEDLFQENRGEKPIIKKYMDGPPILKEEVSAAIRKMKHGKAVGPDNIPKTSARIIKSRKFGLIYTNFSTGFKKRLHQATQKWMTEFFFNG